MSEWANEWIDRCEWMNSKDDVGNGGTIVYTNNC